MLARHLFLKFFFHKVKNIKCDSMSVHTRLGNMQLGNKWPFSEKKTIWALWYMYPYKFLFKSTILHCARQQVQGCAHVRKGVMAAAGYSHLIPTVFIHNSFFYCFLQQTSFQFQIVQFKQWQHNRKRKIKLSWLNIREPEPKSSGAEMECCEEHDA